MHGREGEERKRTRHMWTSPTRGQPIVSAALDVSSSSSPSANSFYKDGRKISVGDCALFKPPQKCPPFIGIIRSLTVGKEGKLKILVNWLYRSGELNLSKGLLLETALNEVFYSFHKDEIPAASLLHPCKVAFLPKGVELPSGTPSFVCRRVYDIANKCLWWLTDQDYINVLQEEVDQLLYRTRIEMHATVQAGGRSPKPMSSPTSSQLKSGSDSVQNSASFPSQVKGRKRERLDQGLESAKRERTTKVEDGDSGHSRQENILKTEIAKITEKGGLVNAEGVEKLVQLIHPDRNVKKIDLASRSMLAAVIAATDKLDCLSQFVQLKGLSVYDEWLQEVHKGKIGDGTGSKDSDKSVEEFLLVLLRALDKLPVNLQALQTCNIGKSVNHLRTHKNSEIQKKARGLVDTWKKRVEAEMNINDAKAGSSQTVPWSTRTRLSEVGQGGNKNSGGSSDVAVKSSVTQLSASRTSSVKITQGENAARSASPGSMKSVPSPTSATTNSKDGQPRTAVLSGVSDLPISNARDEKSSSSSQSHNNSQSCSSDHAKTGGFSGKEDARSSTAMSVNKISGSSSRHRKSVNGISGTTSSGGHRESGRNSSAHKNSSSEKLSQSGLTEKAHDGASVEGSAPKLIVKIPNRGRSPAESASGGSFDDPSIMNSRASSPVFSEKNDQYDHSSKEKIDYYRASTGADINTESWQSNDFKDVLTASDEGNGSPAAVTDEERCRTVGDSKKMVEASKAASSSSGNENKAVNIQDASFSSINALIDSCVKYSETNASLSAVDDVGMKLLASVAAGEISKSELTTPAGSPEINTNAVEQSCPGNAMECEGKLVQSECHANCGNDEHKKQDTVSGDSCGNNDNDLGLSASEVKVPEEQNRHITSSTVDLQQVTEACPESKEKSSEIPVAASESTVLEARVSECSKQLKENKNVGNVKAGGNVDVKVNEVAREVEMDTNDNSTPHPFVEVDVKGDNCTIEELSSGQTAQKVPVVMHDSVKGTDENVLHPSDDSAGKAVEDHSERECRKTVDVAARSHAGQSEIRRNECENDVVIMPENRSIAGLASGDTGLASEHVEENSETKEAHDQHAGQSLQRASRSLPSQEMEQHPGSKESKLTAIETEEAEECTSATADASSVSAAGMSDVVDAKVEFDLNEGFSADDGKSGEFNSIPVPGCAPAVRVISPVPFPASTMSSGITASITVAAAAKGPFVPPEDLLKSKGELGWKGSAATSAFRPAEPRKIAEMPLGTPSAAPISDATAGKQSRQLLDIDLNVPDERMLDDTVSQASCRQPTDGVSSARCPGGLGLDLNQADEASDVGNCSTGNGHKMDVQFLQVKPSSHAHPNHPNREASALRDFDLNDGPAADEVISEPTLFTHQARSSVPSQPPASGPRTSTTELGSFSSWFPSAGNTYSAVTISSIMPDRGDQPFSIVAPNGPQRMLGPATGGSPFGPDVYRAPVLSSSAMPYPSAPYQYPVFPFNSGFPLPSSSFSGGSTTYVDSASGGRLFFPTVNSQLIGPASTVSSHYPTRPYVFSLPDGSGAADGKKWRGQGLDLNAGPGGPDVEGRDESSTLLPRQLPVASSQALAEEQVRMFQLAGGVLKRKEPDGGWDSYKQSSWQ
ncbi:uncharacterized protein LOC114737890 [Neltuma alba]|uniref:uncharacterized protein LOC114737890 n=1 Tax=Neltuma alba TaxID=207710 RepID=UPI0010A3DFAD|nr:uncharacterized protein LOC114737890 [Prosopis alba]XP_028781714.1 uncharacterized protein LOC114737890 [Prosopis alba]